MKNNTMKEKLLIKSIKTYMVASAIAFLVGIPVFYYTIQKLWLEDIDDSLRYQKEELLDDGIDENIRLSKTESLISKPDSIYFYESFDSIRGHVEPFREIRSYGMINGEAYEIRIRRDMVEKYRFDVWNTVCLFSHIHPNAHARIADFGISFKTTMETVLCFG